MTMVTADGAGTRKASHGATPTRRALSTIATAPRCASHPATTPTASNAFAQTTARPAIWTSAIAGTATRFKTRPAAVTREKVAAMTGSKAISTAADAVSDVASQESHRGHHGPCR